ncbi:protein KINESIN LIGHT CHAIN-RELATED 2 isoform X1 [Lycium barbarum]|uniref:protein KINESIN LIGHT CHAIN-RELATED 2 isoform X1 n=1 Tax=Lycium barbarum TaxID=112863 RepID=UPI00293E72EC|nr:protein KINESIN LIGHT CHAIN-RELATED 2 isoform X1 [Lycium barbarum]
MMFSRKASANLLRRFRFSAQSITTTSRQRNYPILLSNTGKCRFSNQLGSGGYYSDSFRWIFLFGPAAVILGVNVSPALAEEVSTPAPTGIDVEISGLRKIEDGSVVSNIHTSKWRVFTDSGRDLFLQGKLEEAEKLFLSALQEAKEGFGDRDPHVASAYNNLAELYRVEKAFNKAEPMYLEAINILEESFGQDDVRVAAALHNLGQFYLMQRKLEQARGVYERALKIKRRVLGEAHSDYADTMYHLGTVLYLQGKYKDSEALVRDSIRILEDGGQGESMICTKRMRQLAEIYIKSDRLEEAENVLRKILHIMELAKGWTSLETVIAAERLALTLQSLGNLKEAQELLERCLEARRALLPEDHIQIAANLLHIARVKMLDSNKLHKSNVYQARAELDMAKDLLRKSIRVAQKNLVPFTKEKGNKQSHGASLTTVRSRQSALVILLQSLNALSLLEMTKSELEESKDPYNSEAESALRECLSAYKEFVTEKSLSDAPGVKAEYLLCLKHLVDLISDNKTSSADQSGKAGLKELKDEIKRVEVELSTKGRRRS